ncbi:integrin alpha-X-like isoform 1-T1 [Clarias gariepinus]
MEKMKLLNNRQLTLWRLCNALLLIVVPSVTAKYSYLNTEHPKIFNRPKDAAAFGYHVCHFGSDSVLVTDPLYNNGTGSVHKCVYKDDQCEQLNIEVESDGALGLSLACTDHRAVVCSPHVQQECEGFHYLHGVCVELNNSFKQTHTHKPVFQECQKIPPLDAVILFDDSLSITDGDFKKMINFIKDVIRSFTNPRGQVAVAKFSTQVSAVFHFENFAADRNADKLMSLVTHSKGNTYTPSAIRFVLNEMFQEKVGMRNNSQKLLVVVTDGKSNDPNDNFTSVIALANEKGVTRFAIGVGNEYTREELQQIATEPRYVFETPDFSSLSSIVSQLTERIFSIEGTSMGNSSSIQLELSQGGFSVALSEDVSVFGAVGTFSWSGGLEEKIPGLNASFINASSVEEMNNSYLGYSVAMATVLGARVYFAGAPRHKHEGAVFGFTQDAHTHYWSVTHTVRGTQLGSYFGAELCVVYGADVVLLAVGAPMFYTAGVGGEVHICSVETGALNCSGVLRGAAGNAGGRFGSALTALQDLNEDSMMELAVGAPLEEKGKGAVYVFTSYRRGFRSKYTQRVSGAAVKPTLQYFGLSLHSVGDLSSDGLPDLVVGSGGAATVLRTQPVICVPVSITLDPPIIAQNLFHCSAPRGLNTPIATATVCLELKEVSIGNIKSPLHADVSVFLELDSGSVSPRLVFYPGSSTSHWNTTVNKTSVCHSVNIAIQNCISDYQGVPLSGRLTVRGHEVESGLRPIVHPDCPNTHTITHTVLLEKVCGEDHVCVSDLSVSLNVSSNMVVKIEGFRVNVSVVVINGGEDASGTELAFLHPSLLLFTRVTQVESIGHVECSSQEVGVAMNLTHTTCRLRSAIFRQRAKMVLIMSFQLSEAAALGDRVDVNVTVKSKNENPGTLHDNHASVSLPVKRLVHFLLRDGDSPQYILYNNSALLRHTYKLTRAGDLSPPVSVVFVLKTPSGLIWDVSSPGINATRTKCENPELLKPDKTSQYRQKCQDSSCHLISCSVSFLPRDQPITFDFRGKIQKQTQVHNVNVESWGLVSFDHNQYTQYLNEDDLQLTIVTLVDSPSLAQIALIVSLSVLFGVLVMIFIFVMLYRVGFFKSKSFEHAAQDAGEPTAPPGGENDYNTPAENTDGQTAGSDTHTENPNTSNNCNVAHVVEETTVL